MEFYPNDPVIVLGEHGGDRTGVVEDYDDGGEVYAVRMDEDPELVIGVSESRLVLREDTETGTDPLTFGMSSQGLADHVDEFVGRATDRVLGDGKSQYSFGTHQKFEVMEFDDLLVALQEELEDSAVYASMLDIRIQRIREALKGLV